MSGYSFSRLRRDVEHWLYRCWGSDGRLLYVGVTNSYSQRLCHHRARTPWWPTVAEVSTASYPNRHTALNAEALAIKAERPIHNRHKTAGGTEPR
jgi:predicted GIY-YIG superfamily endonuclease